MNADERGSERGRNTDESDEDRQMGQIGREAPAGKNENSKATKQQMKKKQKPGTQANQMEVDRWGSGIGHRRDSRRRDYRCAKKSPEKVGARWTEA
jgi:hypothetical protein